jgi:uncharacterized protein (TIGR00299 family) protein
MTVHLHFDCFSGISGDMMLGALVDGGLPIKDLRRGLASLGITGYEIRTKKVMRSVIQATKVDVVIHRSMTHPLTFRQILRLIAGSRLSDSVKDLGRAVFIKIAEAESAVHGVPVERVHFHEVGVIDSLVDVIGTLLGCQLLGVSRVTASPVNVGTGFEQSAHGTLPVPGPAVARLAQGVPIYSEGPKREFTTPTGMAVLRTLVEEFRALPPMLPTAVGYGAGEADPHGWPNVLRLFLGEVQADAGADTESVFEIETNLDDMNPQAYETVMERLFAAGALDVTLAPVVMKRGRPGTVLTALANKDRTRQVAEVMLRETTALGVRYREVAREVLPRTFHRVSTKYGAVRMKVASRNGVPIRAVPEYADCRALAERSGKPVRDIMEEAIVTYHRKPGRWSAKERSPHTMKGRTRSERDDR